MCTETEPRFSFSRDLSGDGDESHPPAADSEQHQCRRDADLLSYCSPTADSHTTSDHPFEFRVDSRNGHYPSSSADELFAGGIILPFHLLHRDTVISSSFSPSSAFISAAHRRAQSFDQLNLLPLPPPAHQKKPPTISAATPPHETAEDQPMKPPTKSFWGFKRSTSLSNCDLKKTLISSLPPLLSRSKSTGSVPIPKKASHKNEIHHQRKPIPHNHLGKSSSSSSSNYAYSVPQKPPLKKNSYGGSGGGGFSSSTYGHNQYANGAVRISPVLNVPTISRGTANFFGLGSILTGKEKKSRK